MVKLAEILMKTLSALSLMLILSTAFADIYKWVDSRGVVHFSDTPHSGATKIELPEAQSYSPPAQSEAPLEHLSPNSEHPSNEHAYSKIQITQPDNEATIRNNQGSIAVTVQVEPDLFSEDKLQLIFDGSPLGEPQTNTLFQLSGIYRGAHTLGVQIVDASGSVLDTSDPITIYMFRPRVGMGTPGK